MARSDLLLVIGSNPPSETSGVRTMNRLQQAREILGFDDVRLANLFSLASYRSGGVSELGVDPEGWLSARPLLEKELDDATAVLLGYGTQPPVGPARFHFREQLAWLGAELLALGVPTRWVGGAPRHPSRWQRYTHRTYPDLPYLDALSLSIEPCPRPLSFPSSGIVVHSASNRD